MAKKTITVEMNSQSINDAIIELRKMEQEFMRKFDIFVSALTNDSIAIARTHIQTGAGNEREANVYYQVDRSGEITTATIWMTGRDWVFVEFGAGIYYNPADPPHAANYGLGVGTYPGQTHAFDNGWWYTDGNGLSQYTHGTEGTAPMYHAAENIRNNAIKKALQIFR